MQRGEAALLDAPARASLCTGVCVIWRGGKSPPGAVPGTFEQEVALPQVHWQKSRAGSVMLQQEKKECEPMQGETGVSAPVARNWAENREKKTPNPKEQTKANRS